MGKESTLATSPSFMDEVKVKWETEPLIIPLNQWNGWKYFRRKFFEWEFWHLFFWTPLLNLLGQSLFFDKDRLTKTGAAKQHDNTPPDSSLPTWGIPLNSLFKMNGCQYTVGNTLQEIIAFLKIPLFFSRIKHVNQKQTRFSYDG